MVVPLASWTVVACVVAALSTVRFMVNDDAVMAGFASGDFTGRPSAHLVFIGILPGLFVSRLSMMTHALPWYTLTLYALDVVSLSVVTQCWRRHRPSLTIPTQFVLGLAMATLASVMFVTPTFTVTAMITCFAAVVSLTDLATQVPRQWWWFALPLALFGASASVRFDAFLGGTAVGLPLILLCCVRLGARRTVGLGIAMVCLAGFIVGSNRLADNADWTAYRDFNDVRGAIHGTTQLALTIAENDTPEVKAMLQANGWIADDLTLFRRWYIENPEVYNIATLERLRDVTDERAESNSWSGAWRAVVPANRPMMGLVLAAGIALAIGGARRALFAVGQLAWAAAVCTWVARSQRFPARIAIPLLAGVAILCCIASLLVRRSARATSQTMSTVAVATFAVGMLAFVVEPLWSFYAPSALSSSNADGIAKASTNVRDIRRINPDGTFILLGAAADVFAVEATSGTGTYGTWPGILTTGWNAQSPSQAVRIRRLELQPDLGAAAVDQPDIRFVARRSDARNIVQSLRHHRGIRTEIVVDGTLQDGAVVFRLVTKLAGEAG